MAQAQPSAAASPERHGRDPRYAPPWIAENDELLAELTAASSGAPKAATASSSAAVAPIVHLEDLNAALDKAAQTGKLVCVKYYAPWCKSCLKIKPLYERVAEGAMGEHVDFYEVDGGAARVLVAYADVTKMPCTHVYAGGALAATGLINNKALFDEFEAGLVQLVLRYASFGRTYSS